MLAGAGETMLARVCAGSGDRVRRLWGDFSAVVRLGCVYVPILVKITVRAANFKPRGKIETGAIAKIWRSLSRRSLWGSVTDRL